MAASVEIYLMTMPGETLPRYVVLRDLSRHIIAAVTATNAVFYILRQLYSDNPAADERSGIGGSQSVLVAKAGGLPLFHDSACSSLITGRGGFFSPKMLE